jgi:hypothetical protein
MVWDGRGAAVGRVPARGVALQGGRVEEHVPEPAPMHIVGLSL